MPLHFSLLSNASICLLEKLQVFELPAGTTSILLEPGEVSFKLSKIFQHFPHYFCLCQLYLGQHSTEYLLGRLSFISGCFCVSQLLNKAKASVQKSIYKTKAWRKREALINRPVGIYCTSNEGDGRVLPACQDTGKCLSDAPKSNSACSATKGTSQGWCSWGWAPCCWSLAADIH